MRPLIRFIGLSLTGLLSTSQALVGQDAPAASRSLLDGLSREIRDAKSRALRGVVSVEFVHSYAAERAWVDPGFLVDTAKRLIVTSRRSRFHGGETAYVRFLEPETRCYRATVVGSLPKLRATVLHLDRLDGAHALPEVRLAEGPLDPGTLVIGLQLFHPTRFSVSLGLLSEVLPRLDEDEPPRLSFQLPRDSRGGPGLAVDGRGEWLAWLPDASFWNLPLDISVGVKGGVEEVESRRLRRVEVDSEGHTVITEEEHGPDDVGVETTWPFAVAGSSSSREGISVRVLRERALALLDERVQGGFSLAGSDQPWLGVMISPALEDEGPEGLRVVDLFEGSPARLAGLEREDLIVEADGDAVRVGGDLVKIIARVSQHDHRLRIKVLRGERTLEVTAQLDGDGASTTSRDTQRREDGK